MSKLKKISVEAYEKPKGFEDDLSEYKAVAFDAWCGKPVAWGFDIVRHLGDERFNTLGAYGSLEVVDRSSYSTTWALIVKELTIEDAIKEYGEITKITCGPKGGYRSVIFGDTHFISKRLNPLGDIDYKTDTRVEIER